MSSEYLLPGSAAIPMKPVLITGGVRTIGPGRVTDAGTPWDHLPENSGSWRPLPSHQRGIDIFQEH
ncbi:hypothetical protein [Methanoregula sp.]|uniref:hypothetical protein n=1 Tax=Methanoregula sp. TaxID=2052170 RepID=UPI0035691B00